MANNDAARVLGVDVGQVRIGLALSCPLGMFASPLEVLWRRQGDPFGQIAERVATHQVVRVVVGLPLRLCGTAGPAAIQMEEFAARLRAHIDAPVVLWDERLSTAQAQRNLIAAGMRRDKRRLTIDKVAAALILQSYLDAQAHAAARPD